MPDDGVFSWPKNPSGTIDWETVFEDPETGLIPLIQQAHSPAALKKSAFVIIKNLYTRKDDPPKVEFFISQLNEMIPDDLPADSLSRVGDAVIDVMRKVKEERIRKAVEYEENEAAAKAADADAAEAAKEKKAKERRAPEKSSLVLVAKKESKIKKAMSDPKIIAAAVATAIIAVTGYFYFKEPVPEIVKKDAMLIRQIRNATIGKMPRKHIFGGAFYRTLEDDLITITAEGVPKEFCFNVAWGLVNRGTIIINGKMSRRISPTILKDLCDLKGETATIVWRPRPVKKLK